MTGDTIIQLGQNIKRARSMVNDARVLNGRTHRLTRLRQESLAYLERRARYIFR